MLRRERLRVAARVAGGRPGARGGVEQVRLGNARHRSRQDDPGAREERPPPLETLVGVLRLGEHLTRQLPERHLRVHLDHPLVHLCECVHLEDLLPERKRLLRDSLAGDGARDLVRLRERSRLERRARRGRKDAARAAGADERARAGVGRPRTQAGGSMGMSTAITLAFSDTTSVNVGCVDTWTSPLGSRETATQPFRYPSTPATSTLVSGRDTGAGGGAAVASRNPSTTSRASATFIASGLSTGIAATVSPSAPLIVTVPLFVPSVRPLELQRQFEPCVQQSLPDRLLELVAHPRKANSVRAAAAPPWPRRPRAARDGR